MSLLGQYHYEVRSNFSLGKIFSQTRIDTRVAFLCLIIAILIGITLSIIFISKKRDGKFTKFLGWLYDFLNFKKLVAETLLKILYIIMSCHITIFGLAVLIFSENTNIGNRITSFVLIAIVGNIVLRLSYEFLLVILIICRNTTDIKQKIGSMHTNNQPEKASNLEGEIQIQSQLIKDTQQQATQIGVVFCKNCGNEFDSTALKCPHCGLQRK